MTKDELIVRLEQIAEEHNGLDEERGVQKPLADIWNIENATTTFPVPRDDLVRQLRELGVSEAKIAKAFPSEES